MESANRRTWLTASTGQSPGTRSTFPRRRPKRRIRRCRNEQPMRIAVDTGGTFTDCVFVRDGKLQIIKVASQREHPEVAIGEALAAALRDLERASRAAAKLARPPTLDLVCGTTVGTNALLERRGGRIALITTAGFEDVLEIGRQARPKLYDFFVDKPEPLVPASARIGLNERLAWDGSIIHTLTEHEIRQM